MSVAVRRGVAVIIFNAWSPVKVNKLQFNLMTALAVEHGNMLIVVTNCYVPIHEMSLK
jgi:hypothetical protein